MDAKRTLVEVLAVPRARYSVAGVFLAFIEERARRMGRAIDLDADRVVTAQAMRDRASATYAAVAQCTAVRDDNDHPDRPLVIPGEPVVCARQMRLARRFQEAAGLPGRLIDYAYWCVSSTERGQLALADEMGVSVKVCERIQNYTRNVLRLRMSARGLLVEEQ